MMPFKSKAQKQACYAKKDPKWDCAAYAAHGDGSAKMKTKPRPKKKR